VLFGESIPSKALSSAFELASKARAILVVGTSGIVEPAASLPLIVKRNHGKVVEINLEPTVYSHSVSDVVLQGSCTEILPMLIKGL
jgi:NAD-dependent deacetylase